MGVIVRPELNNGWKPVFGSGYRPNPWHPLNKGLVAWFLCNENGGLPVNLVDSDICPSYNGYWDTGKYGRAISLSAAASKYAQLPKVYCPSVLPFTVVTSFRVTNLAANRSLLSTSASSTNYYGCWANLVSTGALGINYGDAGTIGATHRRTLVTSAGTISINNDYIVSASMTGAATGYFYVNGVSVSFTTSGSGGTLSPGSSPGYIGAEWIGSASQAYFTGLIHFVSIYNRSLSDKENKELHFNPYGTPDNPRLLFPSTRRWFVPSVAGGFALPIGHYHFNNMRA